MVVASEAGYPGFGWTWMKSDVDESASAHAGSSRRPSIRISESMRCAAREGRGIAVGSTG